MNELSPSSNNLCKEFWMKFLHKFYFEIIIVIDNKTARYIYNIFKFLYPNEKFNKKSLKTNWGNTYMHCYTINNIKILKFPHFGRYKLFSRSDSVKQIDNFFGEIFKP